MKKISKLKLNALSEQNLEKKEQAAIVGGTCCGCNCAYVNSGGSSTDTNSQANHGYGYNQGGGYRQYYCSGSGWYW